MKPRWLINHKIPNNTRRLQSNKSQPTLTREGRDYPRAWLARENRNTNLWSCRKPQCLLESFSVSSRWKIGCWGFLTCTSLYFPPFNSNLRWMGRTLPATLQKVQDNMGRTICFLALTSWQDLSMLHHQGTAQGQTQHQSFSLARPSQQHQPSNINLQQKERANRALKSFSKIRI